jgi:hypothetical protein
MQTGVMVLGFLVLAAGCMFGGWYAMHSFMGGKGTDRGFALVPSTDTGRSQPPTKGLSSPADTGKIPQKEPDKSKDPDPKPKDPDPKPKDPDPKPKDPDPKPKDPDPKPKDPDPKPKDPPPGVPVVAFDQHIKPLFTRKCGECHGDTKIQGGFDVRTVAAMKKKGDSEMPGLVPGDLKKSELYVRLLGKDGPIMPPKNKLQMTPEEIDMVKNWILGGARETAVAAAPTAIGDMVGFEKHILPIFTDKCANCHGAIKPRKDINLTALASILKGGTAGEILTPGKPDMSLLWEVINNNQMPPPDGPKPLTAAEKALIKKWIETGAKDNKAAMIVALR